MNASLLIKHRLINQQVAAPSITTAQELVHWMIAMQAQEYAMAKWAIGLRLAHATDALVEDAFNKGEILRTHLMRPTWHFVSPADIRWLLALTAPRINALSAFMFRQVELDTKVFNRSNAIIEKELTGGKHLTRTELQQALEKKKIIASGHRLSYIMMRAEIDGLICSGPRQGKQFTYALIEERVPAVPKLTRKEALIQFARRYFTTRGPATAKDFASWSGMGMNDLKEAIAALPSTFIRETWNGQEYIFQPTEIPKGARLHKNFLMPIYDEYGMSYKDRSHIFNPKLKLVDTTIFNNMVILEGQIAGGWTRKIDGRKLVVDTAPFWPLSKASQNALQQEVKRFRKFNGD